MKGVILMKNSEILARYKQEVNSEKYSKIHDNYRNDYSQLSKKYEVVNKGSKPLAIISALLFLCAIVCIPTDQPIMFWIFCGLLVLVLIIWKINNAIYSRKEDKKYSYNSAFSNGVSELNSKYLIEYNSVIGYKMELNKGCCCDYDENTENYYCCVTGRQLHYPDYIQCEKAYAFDKCKYSKMYYDNLYED